MPTLSELQTERDALYVHLMYLSATERGYHLIADEERRTRDRFYEVEAQIRGLTTVGTYEHDRVRPEAA